MASASSSRSQVARSLLLYRLVSQPVSTLAKKAMVVNIKPTAARATTHAARPPVNVPAPCRCLPVWHWLGAGRERHDRRGRCGAVAAGVVDCSAPTVLRLFSSRPARFSVRAPSEHGLRSARGVRAGAGRYPQGAQRRPAVLGRAPSTRAEVVDQHRARVAQVMGCLASKDRVQKYEVRLGQILKNGTSGVVANNARDLNDPLRRWKGS